MKILNRLEKDCCNCFFIIVVYKRKYFIVYFADNEGIVWVSRDLLQFHNFKQAAFMTYLFNLKWVFSLDRTDNQQNRTKYR